MQKSSIKLLILLLSLAFVSCQTNNRVTVSKEMIVRLSEIEIVPEYLNEYLAILKEESAASVKVEPGVISIFPMFQKNNSTEIRILEIYASKEAYEMHIKSPHFKHYKTATAKMVKELKLVDMGTLNVGDMPSIFKKMN